MPIAEFTINGISYTYNAQGWLVEELPGAYKVEHLYDPQGREVGLYDGVHNTWYSEYIPLGERVIANNMPRNTIFVHADHLDSSTMVTDQGGNVVQDQLLYPWGNQWKYANGQYDLHFAGMPRNDGDLKPSLTRIDSTSIGRWLSPDPENAGAEASDPQSWNAYAYVRNNPTTLTDPAGEDYKVCVNNENGGQNCVNDISNAQFKQLEQNPGSGVTFRNGVISVTVNGQTIDIGTYQNFVGPKSEGGRIDSADVANMAIGSALGLAIRGGISVLEGVFGSASRQVSAEVVAGTGASSGEAVVATGAKGVARDAIENGPFNSAVKANLKRQLQAIGNNATVTIEKLPDGSARISWARPGFEGSQKFVKLVDSSGRTVSVTQYGYDSAGSVVHVDRKF